MPTDPVARDMATITAGFNAKSAVFEGESATGTLHERDVEVRDEYGGSTLRRMTVLHVAVASFVDIWRGHTGTVADVTYTVHDNRLIAGGAIRELVLAR